MYPVYYFAGGFLGALALLTRAHLRRRTAPGSSRGSTTRTTTRSAGSSSRSSIFWAYVGVLPAHAHLDRQQARRGDVLPRARSRRLDGDERRSSSSRSSSLPFFVLLSYDLKRRRGPLAAVAAWLLAAHYLDVHWLVMPAARPQGRRVALARPRRAPRRRRAYGGLRGPPAPRRAHGPRPRSGAAEGAPVREPMTYRVRHPELHQEEDRRPGLEGPPRARRHAGRSPRSWSLWAADAPSRARMARAPPVGRLPGAVARAAAAWWRGSAQDRLRRAARREPQRAQRAELERYGWVDAERGIVRIPIDRAIDLVVSGRRP